MKLAVTLVMLVAGSAAAQDRTATPAPAGPVSPAVSADVPARSWYALYEGNRFGLQVDAGAPAGATAALVFRPWSFLRLNAGVGSDIVAFGVKGGVTLIPFHWAVVPTLGLEGGHFFQGDATKFGKPRDAALNALLHSVGYDYLSADVGVEFGSQDRFVFYIRAGITQLYPSTGSFQAALQQANPGIDISVQPDPSFSARSPAARLGFILYLF